MHFLQGPTVTDLVSVLNALLMVSDAKGRRAVHMHRESTCKSLHTKFTFRIDHSCSIVFTLQASSSNQSIHETARLLFPGARKLVESTAISCGRAQAHLLYLGCVGPEHTGNTVL